MITAILTERQDALLAEERAFLDELAAALRGLDDTAAGAMAAAAGGLDDLFFVSVTGAPGAPVDSLARALVGEPPPSRLTLAVNPPGHEAGGPRRADLAVYLTPAHAPLAPAEHSLLLAAAESAERLLVVVDEAEMLRLAEDLDRMEEAVEVAAERVLGFRPLVQMVSTAAAGDGPPPRDSLAPVLARRVVGVLRSPEILRPKLLRPLDEALDAARRQREAVEEGLAALAGDLENLEVLEGELDRFERTVEEELRRAEAEVDAAAGEFGARAGRFVRRGSRPFPFPRRLGERFEREAVADLPDRLREAGTRLEERIAAAAAAARRTVVDRVTSVPTERPRAPSGGREGGAELAAPGAGPVVAELEASGHAGRLRQGDRPEVRRLRRTSLLSLVLLALGLAFAAVPLVAAAAGGMGPVPVVLGAGLGGAAVLAALRVLQVGRRRLTEDLAGRVEDLRKGAAAAFAVGAERAAREGRASIRAPVARYADGVAAERDRLAAGRDELERLLARLEDLRRRAAGA